MPRPHPALSVGRPQVFAHRGGAALRPENTLLAFDHGMSLGADGLELDVHLSRDGVVVVHHDRTVDRTTNGRGPIADLTADDLARLDAGYHFEGFRGAAAGVPTLESVLRRYPAAPLIIELKVNDPVLAHRTIDEVRARAPSSGSPSDRSGRASCAPRGHEPASRARRARARLALYRSWARWPVRHPPSDAFRNECRIDARRLKRFVVRPRGRCSASLDN